MIATLMLMSIIGWSYWLMHRAVRSPQVMMPVAAPDQRATRAAAVLGLEDDPEQWRDQHQPARSVAVAGLVLLRQSEPATCSRHLGRPGGQQAAGTTGGAGPGGRQSGRSPRRLPVGGDWSTRDN